MKTREDIITAMCYTYRHDYGLDKKSPDLFSSGTTQQEKEQIWTLMSQIFDNDIEPHMEFKNATSLG